MTERDLIVIGGSPGSGKSRLGQYLVEYIHQETPYDAAHISVGDRVRTIANGTTPSRYAYAVQRHITPPWGTVKRMNDSLVTNIVCEAIDDQPEADFLFLDGYPRYESQVSSLLALATDRDVAVRGLIIAVCPPALALHRMNQRTIRHPERALSEADNTLRLLRHQVAFPGVQQALEARGIPLVEITTEHDKDLANRLGRLALGRYIEQRAMRSG